MCLSMHARVWVCTCAYAHLARVRACLQMHLHAYVCDSAHSVLLYGGGRTSAHCCSLLHMQLRAPLALWPQDTHTRAAHMRATHARAARVMVAHVMRVAQVRGAAPCSCARLAATLPLLPTPPQPPSTHQKSVGFAAVQAQQVLQAHHRRCGLVVMDAGQAVMLPQRAPCISLPATF